MSLQLQAIQKLLTAHSDKAAVEANNKFIPGEKRVYGVRNPVINDLTKQFKEGGFALIKELWQAGAYEERLMAVKMIGYVAKKEPAKALQCVQDFASELDNWAICDTLGTQSLKPIVKTHQEQIFALAKKYNLSEDLWQRRLSLVLVEYYTRDKKLIPEINKLVKALEGDKEYYVKKAVIWIKKNIAKGK